MKTFITYLSVKLLVFLFLITHTPAYAAFTSYVAKIPVIDQSEKTKREAIREALGQILKKNSKNSNLLNHPEIQSSLLKAHDFLQSYQYLNEKKKGTFQKFIQVTFDKDEIDRLIQRAAVPAQSSPNLASIQQPANPPAPKVDNQTPRSDTKSQTQKTILIWLATKTFQQTQPELIEYGQDHVFEKLIHLLSKQKNLSVLLPELALANISSATTENIWKLDKLEISKASTPYANTEILAGRLEQEGNGQWKGQWRFKQDEHWVDFSTQEETPEANLSHMMDRIGQLTQSRTDSLTAQGSDAAENTPFLIQVHEINDLKKNAKLLHYLHQLPMIVRVDTVSILPNSVTLEIQAKGGSAAFQDRVTTERMLIPTAVLELDASEQPKPSSKNKIELQYEWQESLLPITPEY